MRTKNLILAAAVFLFTSISQAQNIPPESDWNVEKPAMPNEIQPAYPSVCADGVTIPTCAPVNDKLCWNWCEMITVSVADVKHWDGMLWKSHWAACEANLDQWVDYAESLQKQIGKCKKWGK